MTGEEVQELIESMEATLHRQNERGERTSRALTVAIERLGALQDGEGLALVLQALQKPEPGPYTDHVTNTPEDAAAFERATEGGR